MFILYTVSNQKNATTAVCINKLVYILTMFFFVTSIKSPHNSQYLNTRYKRKIAAVIN